MELTKNKIGLRIVLVISVLAPAFLVRAQEDSIKTKTLDEVEIWSRHLIDVDRLPDIQKTYIWSGKKNEVIHVSNLDANIAEKTPRQIFAKVPGVFVYDMDGPGNQLNISTRGLDPHRGWEFNTRKNGVITNSDMYGYPASHFSLPMEAVDRIEIVRGTGSLQFGAQFGGMMNYVTKRADTTKTISLESVNSLGSYGLLSTYNAIGGRIGKFEYYAYFHKRVSGGYRDNAGSEADAESIMLSYSPSHNFKVILEATRSSYTYNTPGPLTDSMFHANPRQSTRSRNYFNPNIWVPSVTFDWRVGKNTKLSLMTSAVLGSRNSVQFDRPANIPDAVNPATLQYASRQVDIDNFNSYTSELRMLHNYTLFNLQSSLAAGFQFMDNDLHRQQQGVGTTGTDFDLALTVPGFRRDLHFKTRNIAVFAENRFQLTRKFSINPGFRFEYGKSDLTGVTTYYDPAELPNTIEHKFPLFGVSGEYRLSDAQSLYGGWSQAYRPVVLKDIIPGSVYETTDKNLKDAYGYNLEVGYRGTLKSLRWDVTAFQLQYNHRMGIQAQTIDSVFYLYHANVGNSLTRGAEIFVEYGLGIRKANLSFFSSTAFFNARYVTGSVRSGDTNVDIEGNKVETVPNVITRNGISLKFYRSSISLLYSYTAGNYADPVNTETPSITGAVGKVPGYGLLDLTSSFRLSEVFKLRVNVNNITNKQYFTKRPAFYPGPGVWSSDGRSMVVTLGITI